MSEMVKSAVIGGIFTIVGAIIGACATYYSNTGDSVVSTEEYQKLEKENAELEELNQNLQDENEELTKKINKVDSVEEDNIVSSAKTQKDIESNETWLEDITPISCISKGTGRSAEGSALSYKRWTNERDNGGNIYEHGVYVGDSYGSLYYGEVILIYNLDGKYTHMDGTIVLSEQGKNQDDAARLKIIVDDDLSNPKFVTKNYVAAGFLPEDFNIDVTNVKKLSIVLEGIDSQGYWSRDFGIVNAKVY